MGNKKCFVCGNEIPEEAKFCTTCGAKVEDDVSKEETMICPMCGKDIPVEAKFCIYCGANLNDNVAQAETPIETAPIEDTPLDNTVDEDKIDTIVCPVCGMDLEKDAKYCVYCGATIVEETPQTSEVVDIPKEEPAIVTPIVEETKDKPIVEEVTTPKKDEVIKEEVVQESPIEETKDDEPQETTSHEETNASKYCINCGKEIPLEADFCPYCRTSQLESTTQTSTNNPSFENTTNTETNKATNKTTNKSNSKLKWFIIGGVALAAIVVGLIFGIPAIKKSNQYKNAISALDNGNYEEAIASFYELGLEEYKDSNNYYVYAGARKLFDENDYFGAVAQFELIPDFKDSLDYINLSQALLSINNQDYESAAELLNGVSDDFKNAAEYKAYCNGILAYSNGDIDTAEEAFGSLSENTLPEDLSNTVNEMNTLIVGIRKFNNGDVSCKDEFNTVVNGSSTAIAEEANKYLNYYKGIEYYDQGKFYSAYSCFRSCEDIGDASDKMNACFQDRPSTGIIDNNASSSAVAVTIYDTEDGDDMFVKIYDADDNLVQTLYIRDGESCTARFQSGYFRIATAYGESDYWFGTKEAYGSFGTYKRLLLAKDEEYYNFIGNMVYTLRFNVAEGNVNNKTSNYGDF